MPVATQTIAPDQCPPIRPLQPQAFRLKSLKWLQTFRIVFNSLLCIVCVSDHFGTLCIKGLTLKYIASAKKNVKYCFWHN